MSISSGLFPFSRGSLAYIKEMPAKELCNTQLDYQVSFLLIICAFYIICISPVYGKPKTSSVFMLF